MLPWLIGLQYIHVNALLASTFSFAACSLSSSVTSLGLSVGNTGEGSDVSDVEAGEEGAEDDDELSPIVL